MEFDTTPYDTDTFRSQADTAIRILTDYLAATRSDKLKTVVPWEDPAKMTTLWDADFTETPSADFGTLLQKVLDHSTNLQHERYLGHQIASPLPLAAICDMAASLINNGMVVYEVGPAAVAIERAVIRWMANCIGYGENADGVLTSGGSLGNFTALLTARQAKAGYDVRTQGISQPLAIIASEQSHYSVRRAAQMMGIGLEGVFAVETDDQFRLRPECLEAALRRAENAGRKVFAVIGNACSTATGAYDPLEAIADFAEKHDLWFHADCAHGGAALLSEKYRGVLAGLERADSVVWDAHKMLMMPALVTAVVFKEKETAYGTFSQNASYLYAGESEDEWFNPGHRTFECTKRMMGLKVYMALKTLGTRYFADFVTQMHDLTKAFSAMVDAAGDFEKLVEPQSNILCFRYLPNFNTHLNTLQSRIRQALLADGEFYIVQTEIDGTLWLRCTIINPYTTADTLRELLEKIRIVVAKIK